MQPHSTTPRADHLDLPTADRYDILAALKRAGTSAEAIGQHLGCSGRFVGYVIAGQRNSKRVEQALACALGLSTARLHAIVQPKAVITRKVA